MQFIDHPRCNHKFRAPPGHEATTGTLSVEYKSDPVYGRVATSFWQPSAEDLAVLNAGGVVTLAVYGGGHPPVMLGVATKE